MPRNFHEIEYAKQNWSVCWLQCQVNSCLYERLALSKEKNALIKLTLPENANIYATEYALIIFLVVVYLVARADCIYSKILIFVTERFAYYTYD